MKWVSYSRNLFRKYLRAHPCPVPVRRIRSGDRVGGSISEFYFINNLNELKDIGLDLIEDITK